MALQLIASLKSQIASMKYSGRILSLRFNIMWKGHLARDLTPCDFFLWGYLKSKVFTTSPENINELRQRIIEEFSALRQQPEMIRHVMRGMHGRIIRCVERNGGHVEGHGP